LEVVEGLVLLVQTLFFLLLLPLGVVLVGKALVVLFLL
jgi:hypothetical protein